MTDLVFIDTETTSLRYDRHAWEVGLIRRPAEGMQTAHHYFIDVEDLELNEADLMSLKIGRFYERHPQMNLSENVALQVVKEKQALHEIEALTRGAHLVGAVVNFDAEVLGERMRWHGICPSWHYHLIDVEALAVGHLAWNLAQLDRVALPWKSDELSDALGVTVHEEDRHTALGDARWAMDMYDAVMQRRTLGTSSELTAPKDSEAGDAR